VPVVPGFCQALGQCLMCCASCARQRGLSFFLSFSGATWQIGELALQTRLCTEVVIRKVAADQRFLLLTMLKYQYAYE
jgi:hypothetical protein